MMSVIELDYPMILIKTTEKETYLAKFEHSCQAGERQARRYDYKIVETFMTVTRLGYIHRRVFTLLKVSHKL
jgi:hypothetical protein